MTAPQKQTKPEPKGGKDAEPKIPADPQQRARECGQRVQALLEAYGCRIVPFLRDPEPVGTDGSRVILTASYGLVADPQGGSSGG